MVRNTGKHACGVIIADQEITNLIPVTLQEGDLTTQYPKGPSEELGLPNGFPRTQDPNRYRRCPKLRSREPFST